MEAQEAALLGGGVHDDQEELDADERQCPLCGCTLTVQSKAQCFHSTSPNASAPPLVGCGAFAFRAVQRCWLLHTVPGTQSSEALPYIAECLLHVCSSCVAPLMITADDAMHAGGSMYHPSRDLEPCPLMHTMLHGPCCKL